MKLIHFFIGRIRSFLPAINGFKLILKSEKNSWLHLLATIFAISLIFLLRLGLSESLFILSAIFLVWISEIFNTAIEYMLDFYHPELHPKIKIIKDISATAVLLSAFYALIVAGAIIFNFINNR